MDAINELAGELEARWEELLNQVASDMPPEMAGMATTILKMLKEEADAGRPLVNRFNFTKAQHLARNMQLTDWAIDVMLKQGVIVARGAEYNPDIGLRAEVEFAEGKGRGIQ